MLRFKDYDIFLDFIIDICLNYIFTSIFIAFYRTENNNINIYLIFNMGSYPM